MKLGPVTKLDKRNKATSKNFDGAIMTENYEVVDIFPIYSQFGTIWIPDVQCIKLIFSLIVTFYLIKTEKRTKISLTELSQYCFE